MEDPYSMGIVPNKAHLFPCVQRERDGLNVAVIYKIPTWLYVLVRADTMQEINMGTNSEILERVDKDLQRKQKEISVNVSTIMVRKQYSRYK